MMRAFGWMILLGLAWLCLGICQQQENIRDVWSSPKYQKEVQSKMRLQQLQELLQTCDKKIQELSQDQERLKKEAEESERIAQKVEQADKEAKETREQRLQEIQRKIQEQKQKQVQYEQTYQKKQGEILRKRKKTEQEYQKWRDEHNEWTNPQKEQELRDCSRKLMENRETYEENMQQSENETDRLYQEKDELERQEWKEKQESYYDEDEKPLSPVEEAQEQAKEKKTALNKLQQELQELETQKKQVQEELDRLKEENKPAPDPKLPDFPVQQRQSASRRSREPSFNVGLGGSGFWNIIIYGLGILMAGFLAWTITKWIMEIKRQKPEAKLKPDATGKKSGSDITTPIVEDISQLLAEKRYLDACRWLFQKSIGLLQEKKMLYLNSKYLTNYELIQKIDHTQIKNCVKTFNQAIEAGYYACRPVGEEDYQRCKQSWEEMNQYLSEVQK